MRWRDILLEKELIESRTEYKYAMLRAQFGILLGFICFIYIFIDLTSGVSVYLPWYIWGILAAFFVIYFNRKKKYLTSSIIFLTYANMLVFLIAYVEDSQGGAFFYFMATAAIGLVLLNPISKRLGKVSVIFSLALAGLAYYAEGLPLEGHTGDESYQMISFTVNFTLGLISCILVLIFVMDRNEESENTLIGKQKELRGLASELERSKNRYAMALEGTEAGIYEWDISSNKMYTSLQYNKLLGLDPEEKQDIDFAFYKSLIHPDNEPGFSKSLQDAVEHGTRYQHEVQIKLKNGRYKWFLDSGIVSMKNGTANMAVGSIIDINNRKTAEHQLLQKNTELEKTNEELDRFVYRASHDMRAPLSTLLGLLNLAKSTKSTEELEEYHELMINRINTMDGFIKEVTDYSRNARLDVVLARVNIHKMVEGILDSFEFLASESQIDLINNIDPDIEIETDKVRLKVVLNNLIFNAIKYFDVNKDKRNVILNARFDNNCLFIQVIDNGIGIPENYQEKIFEMFYRATERSTGSGLGLYIVSETLQRLKGSIQCKSEEKNGSTFEIRIPIDFNQKC